MTIIITVVPPARFGPGSRTDYVACLDGRELCRSRTPFLSAARVLLREGVPPDTPFAMRWDGSEAVTLRSTVGTAAGRDVIENSRRGPTFAPFRPFPERNALSPASLHPSAAVSTLAAPALAAA